MFLFFLRTIIEKKKNNACVSISEVDHRWLSNGRCNNWDSCSRRSVPRDQSCKIVTPSISAGDGKTEPERQNSCEIFYQSRSELTTYIRKLTRRVERSKNRSNWRMIEVATSLLDQNTFVKSYVSLKIGSCFDLPTEKTKKKKKEEERKKKKRSKEHAVRAENGGRGEKAAVTNHALQAWASWRGSLGDVTDGMGGRQPAKRQNKRTGRTGWSLQKWEAFDSPSLAGWIQGARPRVSNVYGGRVEPPMKTTSTGAVGHTLSYRRPVHVR